MTTVGAVARFWRDMHSDFVGRLEAGERPVSTATAVDNDFWGAGGVFSAVVLILGTRFSGHSMFAVGLIGVLSIGTAHPGQTDQADGRLFDRCQSVIGFLFGLDLAGWDQHYRDSF